MSPAVGDTCPIGWIYTGVDPGIPRGGANLLFGQFSLKTAWKWRKFDRARPKFYNVDPPLVHVYVSLSRKDMLTLRGRIFLLECFQNSSLFIRATHQASSLLYSVLMQAARYMGMCTVDKRESNNKNSYFEIQYRNMFQVIRRNFGFWDHLMPSHSHPVFHWFYFDDDNTRHTLHIQTF